VAPSARVLLTVVVEEEVVLLLLLLLVVWVGMEGQVGVAIVQERHSVRAHARPRVRVLRRRVHLVHELLQIHVIVCRQTGNRRLLHTHTHTHIYIKTHI